MKFQTQNGSFSRSSRSSTSGGFTLVELMVVVVIIGVLATLATYSVRKYVLHAKTVEAREVIASIKAGQEAYLDETFRYLNVSPSLTDYYPSTDLNGEIKVQWGEQNEQGKAYSTLGVTVAQPVAFRYATIAGPAGSVTSTGVPSGFNAPESSPGPYYIVKAISDLNNDGGAMSTFVSSSFQSDIYEENAGQ